MKKIQRYLSLIPILMSLLVLQGCINASAVKSDVQKDPATEVTTHESHEDAHLVAFSPFIGLSGILDGAFGLIGNVLGFCGNSNVQPGYRYAQAQFVAAPRLPYGQLVPEPSPQERGRRKKKVTIEYLE